MAEKKPFSATGNQMVAEAIRQAKPDVIGSILSYVLNKKFTFRHRGRIAQSALRFTGNIAACYLLAYGIAKPAVRAILTDATQQVQENIAMLAGMILFTGFNYLGQRYFVFGEKNEEKTSNRPQV